MPVQNSASYDNFQADLDAWRSQATHKIDPPEYSPEKRCNTVEVNEAVERINSAYQNNQKKLYLVLAHIASVPECLSNLKYLRILILRSGYIYRENKSFTSLPDSFGNLEKLKTLNLAYTQIATLPDSFTNLRALQGLYLNNTQITSLPDNFGDLEKLKSLNLAYTQIATLPDSIGNLRALQYLHLNYTQVTSLPDSFGDLEKLKTLYLSYTPITSLSSSILNLTGLRTLRLGFTQITSLPENFGDLVTLEKLYLSHTQIASLPDSIGNLRALQYLHLNYTQITSLPESFGNLESLKHLRLTYTPITSLPESFGTLRALQYLYAAYTQIATLPGSFSQLPNLQRLELRRSHIRYTDIPQNIRDRTDIDIAPRNAGEAGRAFTDAQSTHTRSIHDSSSRVAKELAQKIPDLNIAENFKRLQDLFDAMLTGEGQIVDGNPDADYTFNAAKRFLNTSHHLGHKDPESQVTVKQFITLAHAASDKQEFLVENVESYDVLSIFPKMLYECQRGYNISKNGRDDGQTDRPICAGGTFNKIAEHLVGRIKGAQQDYRTKSSFELKFTIVIREEIRAYMETPSEEKGIAVLDVDGSLTKAAQELLLPKIKTRMIDEFGTQSVGHQSFETLFNEYVANIEYKDFLDLVPNKRQKTDA